MPAVRIRILTLAISAATRPPARRDSGDVSLYRRQLPPHEDVEPGYLRSGCGDALIKSLGYLGLYSIENEQRKVTPTRIAEGVLIQANI